MRWLKGRTEEDKIVTREAQIAERSMARLKMLENDDDRLEFGRAMSHCLITTRKFVAKRGHDISDKITIGNIVDELRNEERMLVMRFINDVVIPYWEGSVPGQLAADQTRVAMLLLSSHDLRNQSVGLVFDEIATHWMVKAANHDIERGRR
jgi:hypothetical protein